MFKLSSSGSWKDTEKFLKFMRSGEIFKGLDDYGRRGVDLLSSATPVDTGETAHDWYYQTGNSNGHYRIDWGNTHDEEGYFHIAVGLEYGHATGTGGWVEGRDYINPAIQPLIDSIVDDIWREVTGA